MFNPNQQIKKILLRSYLLALAFFCVSIGYAQNTGSLTGIVKDEDGSPIGGATVSVENTDILVVTDDKGRFTLKLAAGKHMIVCSFVGYIGSRKEAAVRADRTESINFQIVKEEDKSMSEVVVAGATKKRSLETQGFAVAIIETKEASLRNLTTNELLDRSVGVRVRQNGGVGSRVEYNLNGMTGSTIGIFLDGIEVSTYGSSFNLNNIPPAMIERIEVYKGVLPSHLTGDYVGGAINVVLKKDASKNNVTAAVSYGSFNTFQADIGVTLREKKSGLSFRGSGFYTYSDNSYEMWGKFAKYTDRNGLLVRDFRAKRFNDTYKSIGGRFELGFSDVKWADQFFLGYNVSDTYSDIPHGTTTGQPYVGRFTEYQAHVFTLSYIKRDLFVKGLSLNINAVQSNRSTYVQDTISSLYNWDGKPIILHTDYMIENGLEPITIKSPHGAQQSAPTISRVDRKIINARSNLAYTLSPGHRISVNHKLERTDRDDANLLRPVNKDLVTITQVTKNIVSANYEAQTFRNKLRTNVLVKYTMNSTMQTDPKATYNADGTYHLSPQTKTTFDDNFGYGATLSYNIASNLFLITSMENGYVMPTEEQMYGNIETNILPNLNLRPEQNVNYNLGFRFSSLDFGKHKLSFYANAFWRNGYDRITSQTVDSIATDSDLDIQAAAFVNLGKTQSRGVEAEVIYVFGNKLNALINFSKFNALYKRKFDDAGRPDDRYNVQIPNEPFFTINANIQYRFSNLLQRKSITSVYYNAGYVGAYDIAWRASELGYTPYQLSHDIGASYRFPSGKMIFSFDAKNVFNAALYDNFGVQKPGRGIYFKLNYTIGKF